MLRCLADVLFLCFSMVVPWSERTLHHRFLFLKNPKAAYAFPTQWTNILFLFLLLLLFAPCSSSNHISAMTAFEHPQVDEAKADQSIVPPMEYKLDHKRQDGTAEADDKEVRLSELRSSFLSVLSAEQKPIKDGESAMSSDELDAYRLLGDGPMDSILRLLHQEGKKLGATDDLLVLAEQARSIEESIRRTPAQAAICSFLSDYQKLPPWVDKDQLQRGQDVFLAYAPAASLSLFYRSLVPGFSAPKIGVVVQSTAYLAPPARPDQSLQRILDTGELLAACTGLGIDALMPGEIGWRTAIHVRVLHAKVRYALLQRKGKRKWDVAANGIPINQEDMAATLLAFSANVLVGIDLVSGATLSEKEKLDYLALWRYIGWLLGIESKTDENTRLPSDPSTVELPPLDPCGPPTDDSFHNTIQRSYALLQSMVNHLGDPDESSVAIAHHLLQVTDRPPPKELKDKTKFYKNGLFYYRSYQCRRFVGDPLANALQLPFHPNPWNRTMISVASGLSWFVFRVYTLVPMKIPFARKWIIRLHGRIIVNLHKGWNSAYHTNMEKLAKARKAMWGNSGGLGNGETTSTDRSNEKKSICPFAMIAQPSQ